MQYVKAHTVHVDSDKATATRDRDGIRFIQYRLERSLDDIVAIELIGANIPNSMFPTFSPATSLGDGNNILEFSLFTGVTTTLFSVTLPTRQYVYADTTDPTYSYTTALASLMNNAIALDATFGNGKAVIAAVTDPEQKTRITVTGSGGGGPAVDAVTLTLLFTGKRNSPYTAMGFAQPQLNVVSVVNTGVNQYIISPLPTALSPNRYIDVSISQISEHRPLSRIYSNLDNGKTSIEVMPNGRNVRFLATPIPKIHQVEIELTGPTGNSSALGAPHDLVFNFYSLIPANIAPVWAGSPNVIHV